jgi:thiol-disulfide isomerase/thioredoxin
MNTLFLTAICMSLVSGVTLATTQKEQQEQPAPLTKQQKIELLCELMNDKQLLIETYEPLFSASNITDAQIKQEAIDTYFATLKHDFVLVYDKTFSEAEIDDLLTFYQSKTGTRVRATLFEVGTGLQKAYCGIMTVIQNVATKAQAKVADAVNAVAEKVDTVLHPAAVIHFDTVAKDKNDTDIRELFNKEIQHDGVTVVKFSSSWCPPCKTYAPIFDEVAEQLKVVDVDGKKISIKYLAIDIDLVPVISRDCSVMSIPTTIFYKNGVRVDSKTGSIKSSDLTEYIQKLATPSSAGE